MTTELELPSGSLIAHRYWIQRVLGRGGFGRTYLAIDQQHSGRPCVLKEFVPANRGDSVVAQKVRELFQREAAILQKLNHPQIPKFYGVFEAGGRLFIAQEYIDGKTYWTVLKERQRQGRAFSQTEIVQWLKHLLRVLDYLHSQRIVHRDISPDNVMLPIGKKLPVLIDFGVVKQAATQLHGVNPVSPDGLIQASVAVGKLGYAPYEQIRMGQCSPRSDLHALAVTAVVLLTGKSPNQLIDPKSLEWRWHSQVQLHWRLVKVLDKMMAEKPQDRYPSARAVLRDLLALQTVDLTVSEFKPRPIGAACAIDYAQTQPFMLQPALSCSTTQVELPSPSRLAVPSPLPTGVRAPLKTAESTLLSDGITAVSQISAATALRMNTVITKPKILVSSPAPTVHLPGFSLKQLSLKRVLLVGLLALLPLGGLAIGVQSSYIASICQTLDNCAKDQRSTQRYQQTLEQAASAKTLYERAQSIADLQRARDRLSDAIAQFSTIGADAADFGTVQQVLPEYRALLSSVNVRLEQETRAADLLRRAEAEAQKAIDQASLAKAPQDYQAAATQWQRALATLAAIPQQTFVAKRAGVRSQEYTARAAALGLRVAAAAPAPSSPSPSADPVAPSPTQSSAPIVAAAPASTPTEPAARAAAPAVPAARPQAQPAQPPRPTPAPAVVADRPAPAPQPSVGVTRPVRVATAETHVAQDSQPMSLLYGSNQFSRGWVSLMTTQTVKDVSVRLDGVRVSPSGAFAASLTIENHSDRVFGFVPVFSEVRDNSGQEIPARILLTDTDTGMVAPGQTLRGEVFLFNRRWRDATSQDLALIIREGTTGNRNFRLVF